MDPDAATAVTAEGTTIRATVAGDLALLASIERAAGRRFRQVGLAAVADDEPPSLQAYRQAHLGERLWVAVLADEVVGYGWTEDLDGQPHLEQISVLPTAGGRGVGVALLRRVLGWAAGQDGARSLTLSTFRDVPWNGPWYRRLGFTDVDPSEVATHRRWRDLRAHEASCGLDIDARVIMRRQLVPTDHLPSKDP